MTVITHSISHPRTNADSVLPQRWTQNVVRDMALTAKGTASIAPQNMVEPTWQDAVDAINPLQQLPVVGEIYRGLTGEKISGIARVAGGFIFGGLAGGLVAAVTAAFAEAHDGQSPGEMLVSALAGEGVAATVGDAPVMAQNAGQGQVSSTAGDSGVADSAIPTVTLTAREALMQQKSARSLMPGTADMDARPDQAAAATSEATMPVLPGSLPRDRLNQKRAAPGFSNAPHPLALSSFIDRLPTGAALLTGAQAQNLELLQGVGAVPAQQIVSARPIAHGNSALVTASPAAPAMTEARNNPLPPQLVRDMMLQAMDKYDRLPPVVAETGDSE